MCGSTDIRSLGKDLGFAGGTTGVKKVILLFAPAVSVHITTSFLSERGLEMSIPSQVKRAKQKN